MKNLQEELAKFKGEHFSRQLENLVESKEEIIKILNSEV